MQIKKIVREAGNTMHRMEERFERLAGHHAEEHAPLPKVICNAMEVFSRGGPVPRAEWDALMADGLIEVTHATARMTPLGRKRLAASNKDKYPDSTSGNLS